MQFAGAALQARSACASCAVTNTTTGMRVREPDAAGRRGRPVTEPAARRRA
jgi:hypothetical protein